MLDDNGNLNPKAIKLIKIAVIALVLIIGFLVLNPMRSVGAGQVGVVTRFGAVNRVANPGLVFKLPLIESIHVMETRTQRDQVDASAASKDLQEVKSTIALNYHLRGEKAVQVYQNVGEDYDNRIIDPALQEAFKATTAKFTASDLIGRREAVKVMALSDLKDRLNKYSIIVDDLSIVNFDFSPDFNTAIEQKQVAQQNLEKAKIDATTALTQASGQAAAQAKLKDSGSLSPEYLNFLAITKWNGILPLSTSGVPFIQIPTK